MSDTPLPTDPRATSPAPPAPDLAPAPAPARTLDKRAWLGRAVIAAFVLVGLLLFQDSGGGLVTVRLSLPPAVYVAGLGGGDRVKVPRQAIVSIDVALKNQDGTDAARGTIAWGGQAAPLSPPLIMGIDAGTYAVVARVHTGLRPTTLFGRLEVDGDEAVATLKGH